MSGGLPTQRPQLRADVHIHRSTQYSRQTHGRNCRTERVGETSQADTCQDPNKIIYRKNYEDSWSNVNTKYISESIKY